MRTSRLVLLASSLLFLAAAPAGAQDPAPMTPIEIEVACAPPPSLDGPAAGVLQIIATQDTVPRGLGGNRDLYVIGGGTLAGVQLGQQFFIRRPNRRGTSPAGVSPGVRTLGWIRIVAVNDSTAIAAVEHACAAIIEHDYLAPYVAPVIPPGADRDVTSGEPDFTSLARVLIGDEERQATGAGDFVLIDRGAAQGLTPGTRVSLYRDVRTAGMPLANVGEAVVISVGPAVSLARITRARDAVLNGDYVAIRK
jgi:hypothetical protein